MRLKFKGSNNRAHLTLIPNANLNLVYVLYTEDLEHAEFLKGQISDQEFLDLVIEKFNSIESAIKYCQNLDDKAQKQAVQNYHEYLKTSVID